MIDPSQWEMEAWKAQVGLFDRLMLVMLGGLFLPAVAGKEFYSPIVLYVFIFIFTGVISNLRNG
jgi:hypothetical protein